MPERKKGAKPGSVAKTAPDDGATKSVIDGAGDPVAAAVDQQALLREYFGLGDADQIVRVAARMKLPTTEAPVEAAAELLAKARSWLANRRKCLVGLMEKKTLEEAAAALELPEPDPAAPAVKAVLVRDLVAAPVMERLLELKARAGSLSYSREASARNIQSLGGSLNNLQSSLPCTLIWALRHIAGRPEVPDDVLLEAFNDCLLVTPTMSRGDEEANESGDKATRNLHDLLCKICDQGYDTPPEKLRDLIATSVSFIDEDHSFRQEFRHGDRDKASIRVKKSAEASFERLWIWPLCVNAARFEWLADHFFRFWERHGKAYMVAGTSAEAVEIRRRKEQKSKNARKAGKASVTTRRNKAWVQHTGEFVTYMVNSAGDPLGEDYQNAIDCFVTTCTGAKDPRTQSGIREFLGTLCNPGNRDKRDEVILDVLCSTPELEGKFQREDLGTIAECRQMIGVLIDLQILTG
jgi:hypothetical protein